MAARRALLVASTGGHLEQITQLAPRLSPEFDEVEFATFDSPQSRSLLEGHKVHTVPLIPPRDLRQASNAFRPAMRIIRKVRFTDVISTGSAIAVPFLMAARLQGVRTHYIESAARTEGPSLTGRMLRPVPGINLYCQYPSWARDPWNYRGSVIDRFESHRLSELSQNRKTPSRAVVTLGTMVGFPFPRAVAAAERALAEVGTPDMEILWQVGDMDAKVSRGEVHSMIPSKEMDAAIRAADVVIAHAGVGSALRVLGAGHMPILLCRKASHGEHIDNHQWLIANELTRRNLTVARDPDDLRAEDLLYALSHEVRPVENIPPIRLETGNAPKRGR